MVVRHMVSSAAVSALRMYAIHSTASNTILRHTDKVVLTSKGACYQESYALWRCELERTGTQLTHSKKPCTSISWTCTNALTCC
jgi:hypothetical protein